MPTPEELLALVEAAAQYAATEVDTWIPEKQGDRIAGEVHEVGTISTKFGVYATTTLRTIVDYVENGETKPGETYVRSAWMGAVLVAQYDRMRPIPGDIVAMHYQKDVTPKSGADDYKLIVATVIDPTTGRSKVPVNMAVTVPTEADLRNIDSRTGEIMPGAEDIRNKQSESPLTPRDDESPL
jgi:hypothetical protein